MLCFTHWLGWLPPARLDSAEHYIMPVMTLAFRPCAIIAQMTRASLIGELKSDYVRTARAKGVSEARIILLHALRNTLVPTISVLGPVVANILTGSFIVEHFFAIPGVAKYFIEAVTNRDVFLIMGVTLVFAVIMIATSLIVDLMYPRLDPRMKNG